MMIFARSYMVSFRAKARTNGLQSKFGRSSEWDACIGVLSKSAPIAAALEAPASWRNSHRDVVESAIGNLTKQRDGFELMEALRLVGVAAGVAMKPSDLARR